MYEFVYSPVHFAVTPPQQGGPMEDGKEAYFEVPLAKTSSYTSGGCKMNSKCTADELLVALMHNAKTPLFVTV